MGNSAKKFVGDVAKAAAKGAISFAGGKIPFIGGYLANWINSKFATGGNVGNALPTGMLENGKEIGTAEQLKALVKEFPDIAAKAKLTVEKIDAAADAAKKEMKAVGGLLKGHSSKMDDAPKMELKPVKVPKAAMAKGGKVDSIGEVIKKQSKKSMAKGGDVEAAKPKKARSAAQLAATAKLVAANKARRAGK